MYHWSLNAGGDNASQASCYVTQTGRWKMEGETGNGVKQAEQGLISALVQGSTEGHSESFQRTVAPFSACEYKRHTLEHSVSTGATALQQWSSSTNKTVRTFWRRVICQGFCIRSGQVLLLDAPLLCFALLCVQHPTSTRPFFTIYYASPSSGPLLPRNGN